MSTPISLTSASSLLTLLGESNIAPSVVQPEIAVNLPTPSLGLPPHRFPFKMDKDGFHFPFNIDMYTRYDRLGEGVMYNVSLIFKPSFFITSPCDAWDFEPHFDLKARGFDASTLSYFASLGINANTWEREALEILTGETHEFLEKFEDGLTAEQHSWLQASGHLDVFLNADNSSWIDLFTQHSLRMVPVHP